MQAPLPKVTVRVSPKNDNMIISLKINGQPRNLDRPKNETLDKPLLRIQKSAAAPGSGKAKARGNNGRHKGKSAAAAPQGPVTRLLQGSNPDSPAVDTYVKNADAWAHGRLLQIGKEYFVVDLNPPLVEKLDLLGLPMVDCPLMALPTLSFAEESATQWRWLRLRNEPKGQSEDSGTEVLAATTATYVPGAADVGCWLQVECTPVASDSQERRGDTMVAAVGPVEAGPGLDTPTARRHQLTPTPMAATEGFRVITYNLLADQYASSDTGQTKLFSYCPTRFLAAQYRWPLIVTELLGFHADVMCLQEVDARAFRSFFLPHLRAAGFDGVYVNKAGKTAEGSATFWRCSRFICTAQEDINFRQLFAAILEPPQEAAVLRNSSSKSSSMARVSSRGSSSSSASGQLSSGLSESAVAAILPLLQASPQLVDSLQRVGTVAQLTLLQPAVRDASSGSSGEAIDASAAGLCILNTHLFYHPRAPHIRTLHVAALMERAHAFLQALPATATPAGRPSVLLCGDLNSDLNEGIPGTVELLRRGKLPADFWDWRDGQDFSFSRRRAEASAYTAEADAFELMAANGATNNGQSRHHTTSQPPTPSATTRTGFGARLVSGNSSTSASGPSQAAVRGSMRPAVTGVDLQIPFRLTSADGLTTDFTNFVRGYKGALDYVWHEAARMHAARQIPLPTLEDVQSFLPSEQFPSDHLSVVFDMAWGAAPDNAATGSNEGSSSDGAADVGVVPVPALFPNVPKAVEALSTGFGVIALPTDTLYGLACLATSATNISTIYDIKRRQLQAPLAVCVGDVCQVSSYGEVGHLPPGLLRALLPGQVTVVVRRRPEAPLSKNLNPGMPTVGIRVPDNGFVRDVCRNCGGALALTSANLSGQPSSLSVHDLESLWPSCSAVFDGGAIPQAGRGGSCIVDLTDSRRYRILRKGSDEALLKVEAVLRAHGMQPELISHHSV